MKARCVDAATIRAKLQRIAHALRDAPARNNQERTEKRDKFKPAAALVESALVAMREPGTDVVQATNDCAAALKMLGSHAELESVLADLQGVVYHNTELR